MKKVLGAVGALVVLGAAMNNDSNTSTPNSGPQPAAAAEQTATGSKHAGSHVSKASASPKASCSFKATDGCTPHVPAGGKVRVDALIWKVQSVRTASSIGDTQYGLGQKADGVFVIVKLKVRSDRSESATLTENVMKLRVGKRTYDSDSDGTIAAMGDGQKPFFFEDIGPDATTTGTVVFDVPASKLSRSMEMRFGELGFGTTQGFVKLPSLSA